MSKKVRIAIVGCGGIARQKHFPALKKHADRAEMVAFCDIIPERAQKAAEEYGVPGAQVCEDYRELCANPDVEVAVKATEGLILTYNNEVCDARFSKCCGGRTETFESCWENEHHPYLESIEDPFCNTSDPKIIQQVLNDYDQETTDFYRWTETLTQADAQHYISRHLKMDDLGDILDLLPIERGPGERIIKLQIVGSKRSFIIGKELEIRCALSNSHLKSAAFTVERQDIDTNGVPARFILHGKGWGHGVGMCQIGAAVMGEQGYTFEQILKYYYKNVEIKKALPPVRK